MVVYYIILFTEAHMTNFLYIISSNWCEVVSVLLFIFRFIIGVRQHQINLAWNLL